MSPKTSRSDAAILADIRRLRQILERRKSDRLKAELLDAKREIETLRAQLRAAAVVAPAEPRSGG